MLRGSGILSRSLACSLPPSLSFSISRSSSVSLSACLPRGVCYLPLSLSPLNRWQDLSWKRALAFWELFSNQRTVYKYIYIYIYIYVNICIYIYVYIYVYIYEYIWIYLYVCMQVHSLYLQQGAIKFRYGTCRGLAACCIYVQRSAGTWVIWPRCITHTTLQHTATHCNTLQRIATPCNTLQHPATHCNTLQHPATHCNTLQHIATPCNTLQHNASRNCVLHLRATQRDHMSYNTGVCCIVLQHVAVCCSTMLQCVAATWHKCDLLGSCFHTRILSRSRTLSLGLTRALPFSLHRSLLRARALACAQSLYLYPSLSLSSALSRLHMRARAMFLFVFVSLSLCLSLSLSFSFSLSLSLSLSLFSFFWTTWLVYTCDMMHCCVAPRIHVWHNAFICSTTHSHVCRAIMCDTMHSYVTQRIHVWYNASMCVFACVAQRIHVWYNAFIRDNAFMHRTWCLPVWHLAFMCDTMHSYVVPRVRTCDNACIYHATHSCVVPRIRMCDVHSCVTYIHVWRTFMCVTWGIHGCDVTYS